MRSSTRRVVSLVFCLGLATSLGATGAGAQAFFSGIGDLYTPTFSSIAYAVSDNGVVVGVSGGRGVRWTYDGGLELLPNSTGMRGAWDVSADGSVAVGWGSLNFEDPLLWTEADGAMPIDLGPSGRATALSADGTTVVGYNDDPSVGTRQAVRWTAAGGLEALGFLSISHPSSRALDVSSDGSIVVGIATNRTNSPGFRWTQGVGMEPIDPIFNSGSNGGHTPGSIQGVSGDGFTLFGDSRGDSFVWDDAEGYAFLGDTFIWGVGPTDASHDGTFVVGGNFNPSFTGAFLWDDTNGVRELAALLETQYGLDLTGWTLAEALGISPNGRYIVGSGTNPAGQGEGWVAHLGPPPPPPPACGLGIELIVSLPLLAALRRRRH